MQILRGHVQAMLANRNSTVAGKLEEEAYQENIVSVWVEARGQFKGKSYPFFPVWFHSHNLLKLNLGKKLALEIKEHMER